MPVSAVALLATTFLYAGFQWTIRVLVYPQFAAVPTPGFCGYEALHQRRVSLAVGPLFAASVVADTAAVIDRPQPASVACLVCLAGTLAVTALAAVPQHRRLSSGFDAAAHRRLLGVDGVRLALAIVACVAAVGYALGTP